MSKATPPNAEDVSTTVARQLEQYPIRLNRNSPDDHLPSPLSWRNDTHELVSVEQQLTAQPAILVVRFAIWPTNLRNQYHLKECSWGVDRGVNGELLLFGMCVAPQTTPLWCLTCRRGFSRMTQHTNAASNYSARVEMPYRSLSFHRLTTPASAGPFFVRSAMAETKPRSAIAERGYSSRHRAAEVRQSSTLS